MLQQTLVLSNTLLKASLAIGPLEWRLFRAMLARTPRQAAEFEELAIPIRELFPRLSGRLSQKEYLQLKKACARLASRVVELRPVTSPAELEQSAKNSDFQKILLLSGVRRRARTGQVYARFNEWLKPYILGLTRDFTEAPTAELEQLRSAHAHGLYWLLRRHQPRGELTLSVEEVKEYLGLRGSYRQVALFKLRVVQPVQRELAATTVAFTYEVAQPTGEPMLIKFSFQETSPLAAASPLSGAAEVR